MPKEPKMLDIYTQFIEDSKANTGRAPQVEVKCKIPDFVVTCKLLSAAWRCGHIRCLVKPVKGSGQTWVNATRVILPNK